MKQKLVRWLRERSRSASSGKHARRHCFVRPGLERLEDRQLLSAGQLDPTFGNGGTVLAFSNPPLAQGGSDAVRQSDGKIVVAVSSQDLSKNDWNNTIVVERFNPDGSLDSSFGQGGRVSLSVPGYQVFCGSAVAIQANGKILVFGEAVTAVTQDPYVSESVLIRLNCNGGVDTTLGGTGYVASLLDLSKNGVLEGQVVVQPDGRIIVAGSAGLARFNADGSPDTSFGSGGTGFTTDDFGEFTGLYLQANGTIAVTSETAPVYGPDAVRIGESFPEVQPISGRVSMFSSDGFLETSFVAFGPANIRIQLPAIPSSILTLTGLEVQADGRIVVAGVNGTQVVLARFNADGTPDTSFGTDGSVDTGIGTFRPVALTAAANGDFLVATTDGSDRQIVLAAFRPDGSADLEFGSDGRTETNFGYAGSDSSIGSVFIQPDGNIVVDAVVWTPGSGYGIGLARFLDGGVSIDPPSNLPPTIAPTAGPPLVPTFTAGGAGPDAMLAPIFTARGVSSTPALALGGSGSSLALALATTTATPISRATPTASGAVIFPETLQPTLDKTEMAGATTGLHSLDLTYFGSGSGSEKERGSAASSSIQDAAFASLTDDA